MSNRKKKPTMLKVQLNGLKVVTQRPGKDMKPVKKIISLFGKLYI